jgi:hypothetical protein
MANQQNQSKREKTEWIYNFIGGGWNTERAHTREEAIAAATQRWSESPTLRVDGDSFRVATYAALSAEMGNFF